MLAGGSAIRSVLSVGCKPKVLNPIVMSDAVDVINASFRPCPVDIEPRKSMRGVRLPVYLNVDVPFVFLDVARFAANLYLWPRCFPKEAASFWDVRQDLCEVRMFHAGILPDREWD